MAFTLPSAQYLMTSNSNRGLVGSNAQATKIAGNLPITTNAQQFVNNTSSNAAGAISQIVFGLDSQSSTTGYDMSVDSRVIVTSVQYNAPNRIQSATMANNGASIDFVSGIDELNFKRFLIGGNDTPFCSSQAGPNTICIDPTSLSNDLSGGTFDATNVSGWAWGCVRFNLSGSSTIQCFFQRVFMFQTTKDAADIPKFTGVSDWGQAFTTVQGTSFANKIGAWISQVGSAYFVPCPWQIGDGVSSTTFNDNGVVIVSPADNAPKAENFRLTNQSMRVYLSLRASGDSVTVSGSYNWGTAAPWDFDTSSASTCTITGATFNGMGEFTLGSSVAGAATFSLSSGAAVISNGANIDGSIINGDLEINDDRDYSNIIVNGDVRINTGANSVVSYSNFKWTGDLTNTGSDTLTINSSNGTSGTTSEAGTGAGQVNIVISATLSVAINEAGCDVVILAAGTSTVLASVNAQAGNVFDYTYSTVQNIDIGVIKPGFKVTYTYGYALPSTDSIFPVSLGVDRSYA